MSMETLWLNGDLLPASQARIGIEDRGFQFADGVYEVIRIYDGRPFTLGPHLDRLWRSADGIQLTPTVSPDTLRAAIVQVIARNGIRDGMVYVQLTRGVAPRNHLFPTTDTGTGTGTGTGTALCYARPLPPPPVAGRGPGAKLLTVQDERWRRCWVKSIALLANVLARNDAAAAGCDEAVFVENGVVTECAASNLFAVLGGKLVTHPVGPKVLPGITRTVLLECAAELGIGVEERPWREAEAQGASELFITSTTREISWASHWNHREVGHGRCGPLTQRLHRALQMRVRLETGVALAVA